jgi:PAS domain S-box-containing protein
MDNDLGEIVDALPGLVWTARPSGSVEFVNARWFEYTGIPSAQIVVDGWPIHPEDLSTLQKQWHAIQASGKPGEMQARLRRFDGTYRWFLFRTSPVADATGQVMRWHGINTDIDEQRCAEDALRASEEQLRLIVDGLPALVSFMSPAGKLERANRHYLDYFGASIEQLKTRGVLHSFHPEDRAAVLEVRAKSLETGQPWEAQGRRRGLDGTYRWFQLRAFPLRDHEGRIALWHLLQTDIQDQKEAQALLNGEKNLLEMVATGKSMPLILDALCHLVEETVIGCYCSVVLIDPSGAHLAHGAAPSLPQSFISSIIGRALNADSGPCAMAAFLNEQIIAPDLAVETRWTAEGWCSMALAHGIRSCWSTPISPAAGTVMGAFAIYHDEPKYPTPKMQSLIGQFAHIASIAVARERAQTALTQALDELKASEGQLVATINTIPGLVWSATPDGNVDFVNQRWCDYTGASIENATDGGWVSIYHPDDSGRLATYWESQMRSGEPGLSEARLRRSDGVYRWFLTRAAPMRDSAGHIVKWYGANTDIEERKQAESLLAGEKQLLEMVAGGGLLQPHLEALCKFVETAALGSICSILLVDPSGLHLQHGAAPSLPKEFNDSLQGLQVNVDSGPCVTAVRLNKQVIASDIASESRWSSFAWCSLALANGIKACWSTPIRSSSGKVLGIFAIYYAEPQAPTASHQNLIGRITHIASIAVERAQNDAALTQSEAFLTKAQRLSSSGSFSWRVATDELMFSEEYYRIFDLDPAKPVTVAMVMSRVHPEDAPALTKMIERARREGTDFDYEHRLVMSDGTVKYIYMVAHRADDPDGHAVYIGAVQDVTQRRLSEDALGRVRSELARVARVTSLGALTASIAHEVNQPLFSITTNASTCVRMLGGEPPNLEGAREMTRRIIRDGNRASEVITRLRAMFVKRDPIMESVDLNEATKEVIALSIGELQRAQVILHTDLAEDLPQVTGDRVQLQQVILNLCLNAADAMSGVQDRPRSLVIKTEKEGADYVRLSVEDTGVGFEPDSAEALFDAFYTTKHGGMGIGLSVSRSIIEGHHGRLWAAPRNGPGATFAFSIPLDLQSAASTMNHTSQRLTQESVARNA